MTVETDAGLQQLPKEGCWRRGGGGESPLVTAVAEEAGLGRLLDRFLDRRASPFRQ